MMILACGLLILSGLWILWIIADSIDRIAGSINRLTESIKDKD